MTEVSFLLDLYCFELNLHLYYNKNQQHTCIWKKLEYPRNACTIKLRYKLINGIKSRVQLKYHFEVKLRDNVVMWKEWQVKNKVGRICRSEFQQIMREVDTVTV